LWWVHHISFWEDLSPPIPSPPSVSLYFFDKFSKLKLKSLFFDPK
jgi:hypothetical protein